MTSLTVVTTLMVVAFYLFVLSLEIIPSPDVWQRILSFRGPLARLDKTLKAGFCSSTSGAQGGRQDNKVAAARDIDEKGPSSRLDWSSLLESKIHEHARSTGLHPFVRKHRSQKRYDPELGATTLQSAAFEFPVLPGEGDWPNDNTPPRAKAAQGNEINLETQARTNNTRPEELLEDSEYVDHHLPWKLANISQKHRVPDSPTW
jgi:hypothetical protein